MKYKINDIYYSIQCEGYNTGIPMVFVRFSGCNMRCDINPGPKSPGGFKCDTEFESWTLFLSVDSFNWGRACASSGR